MSTNPYAAPATHVADVVQSGPEGNFITDGRKRPAGNGWEWIKSGRALTKPQVWLWMGIFVVFMIISMVLGAIPIVQFVAGYFISPVLMGGIMLACHAAYKGGRAEFGHLFAGFRSHLWKLVGIGLSTLLMYLGIVLVILAMVGIVLTVVGTDGVKNLDPSLYFVGGLLFFLVVLALSIPIAMAIWFSYSLVTVNNLPVIDALKASFRGCLKNIVPFLVYGVMMLIFAFLASIPLFLGWLVFGPIAFASIYTSYRDIFYDN